MIKYTIFFILLLIQTSCHKPRLDRFNDPDNMTYTLDIKEIYQSGKPQKIRKLFDYYSSLDLSKKENKKSIENFENSVELFPKKFIAVEINYYKDRYDCGEDSYSVFVLTDRKSLKYLDVNMAKNDEICYILRTDLLYSKQKLFSAEKKLREFWI